MHALSSNIPNMDIESDEDDESDVLEESPCGRYQKRREEVQQRDVPGIDSAFLAMDTEDGFEVVWNEVYISQKKTTKQFSNDKMKQVQLLEQVFDNLVQLDHANLVKFHKYWMDFESEHRRMIFITEYMSSGSLKQFLKKTKKNNKTLKAWKRWCTQILSALSYLHSCEPPIIHGNLTTETIFIQHNGLIKIGSVAPDTIHLHVKTYRQEPRNMHFIAPEYAVISLSKPMTTAVDIYSFGICALEMATIETLQNPSDTVGPINSKTIQAALATLEDPAQRDFLSKCLSLDPTQRPSARELLFHTVLFEVHSLRLLTAHYIIDKGAGLLENESVLQSKRHQNNVIAEVMKKSQGPNPIEFTVAQARICDLEKLLEDVKNGIFPLTAFTPLSDTKIKRTNTPELPEMISEDSKEQFDKEVRKVVNISCCIHSYKDKGRRITELKINLKLEDRMKRHLTCHINCDESSYDLTDELVACGFINQTDRDKICDAIEMTKKRFSKIKDKNGSVITEAQLNASGTKTAATTSTTTTAPNTATIAPTTTTSGSKENQTTVVDNHSSTPTASDCSAPSSMAEQANCHNQNEDTLVATTTPNTTTITPITDIPTDEAKDNVDSKQTANSTTSSLSSSLDHHHQQRVNGEPGLPTSSNSRGEKKTSSRSSLSAVTRPHQSSRRNSASRSNTPISSASTFTTSTTSAPTTTTTTTSLSAGLHTGKPSPQTSRRTSKPSSACSSAASTPPSSPSRFRPHRSPTTSLKKPLTMSTLGAVVSSSSSACSAGASSSSATTTPSTATTTTTAAHQKKQLYYPQGSSTAATTDSHRNLKTRLSIPGERSSKESSGGGIKKTSQTTSRFHTTPVLDDHHYKTLPSDGAKCRSASKDGPASSKPSGDSHAKTTAAAAKPQGSVKSCHSSKSSTSCNSTNIANSTTSSRHHSQYSASKESPSRPAKDQGGGVKDNPASILPHYRASGDYQTPPLKVARTKSHDCNIPLSMKKAKQQEHAKTSHASKDKHSKPVNCKKIQVELL